MQSNIISLRKLAEFIRAESAGGIVMLVVTALALVAANSALAPLYEQFVHFPIRIALGEFGATESLAHWVKDALMVLFFLVVGMELKREMVEGVLADKKQILLPLVAALGGMIFPAIIFLALNYTDASHAAGWAIPSATDIAFALAVLMLAAKNIPSSLKIFLLAIAIFDDLGAILVIAFFYSHGVASAPLVAVACFTAILFAMNRFRVMALWPYFILGIALCIALAHTGIHTTIGGVIVGLMIPMRDAKNPAQSPLNHAMHLLHPWVSFLILPLFAFTAAGVSLEGIRMESLAEPLTLGIILGLFFGKQIGIFGTSWLLIKADFARLPEGANWHQLYGVSILAGIGFTMSLFIGALAFADADLQAQVKLGVLAGSVIAAGAGALVLRRASNA